MMVSICIWNNIFQQPFEFARMIFRVLVTEFQSVISIAHESRSRHPSIVCASGKLVRWNRAGVLQFSARLLLSRCVPRSSGPAGRHWDAPRGLPMWYESLFVGWDGKNWIACFPIGNFTGPELPS